MMLPPSDFFKLELIHYANGLKNSDPTTARQHPTSHPPQPDANADVELKLLKIVIICEGHGRRQCWRGLSFLLLLGQEK